MLYKLKRGKLLHCHISVPAFSNISIMVSHDMVQCKTMPSQDCRKSRHVMIVDETLSTKGTTDMVQCKTMLITGLQKVSTCHC